MSNKLLSNTTIEDVLLKRVKVIGDGEWTLLGTPAELIEELEAVKLAWAEMVLDDLEKHIYGDKLISTVIAEQRQRNNLNATSGEEK